MEATEGLPSPEIFRRWSAIAAVSGALERRTWTQTSMDRVHPNLFVLLVAPPAVGKSQAIKQATQFWYEAPSLHVAPDNVTGASLVDALAEADRKIITPDSMMDFHHLLVSSGEFGVLVNSYDLGFISILNHLYDNPADYRESRRTLHKKLEITSPGMTILAGTQPGYLASLLPEEAWSMGFTSRLTMIYSATPVRVPIFAPQGRSPFRRQKENPLQPRFNEIVALKGAFDWTPEAMRRMEAWSEQGCPPIPEHSKLQHYTGRRMLTALKLCMVSSASRTGGMVVEKVDFERAQDWLLEAEQTMPDIFRDMVHRSDNDVIQELHIYAWKEYAPNSAPVHESRLISFLQTRVPSEKIPRLLDIAERGGLFERQAGTLLYVPKTRTGVAGIE